MTLGLIQFHAIHVFDELPVYLEIDMQIKVVVLRSVPEFAQVALQSLNDQKGYSCSVFCLFRVDIT
jgi:hypothetical protein